MLALTASAKADTRKKIINILGMHSCIEIVANPDRTNIKLHAKEINCDIAENFSWLVKELKEHNVNSNRVLIYCQSIRQCTAFYNFFKIELGTSLYCNGKPKRALFRLVGICIDQHKKIVSDSLNEDNGYLRVLIATSALGMGVDIKGLYLVINYGPPNSIEEYYQAFGRRGRYGKKFHAFMGGSLENVTVTYFYI